MGGAEVTLTLLHWNVITHHEWWLPQGCLEGTLSPHLSPYIL